MQQRNDTSPCEVVKVNGPDFTRSTLENLGMKRPVMCDEGGIPGMIMPSFNTHATQLMDKIGPNKLVSVLNSREQREIILNYGAWAEYFDSTTDDTDDLNSVSINCLVCDLGSQIQLPQAITELDWCTTVVPPEINGMMMLPCGQNSELVGYHGGGLHVARCNKYANRTNPDSIFADASIRQGFRDIPPRRQMYCSMCTRGTFTDFHIDFGGSSVFYCVITGSMYIYLAQPTAENIAKYKNWCNDPNQNNIFFGDHVDNLIKCELKAGSSLVIPSGWIYGVFACEKLIYVGSNFLCYNQMTMQLNVQKLEQSFMVADYYQFPRAVTLYWHALMWYHRALSSRPGPIDLDLVAGLLEAVEFLKGVWQQSAAMAPPHLRPVFASVPPNLTNPPGFLSQMESLLESHVPDRPLSIAPAPPKPESGMDVKSLSRNAADGKKRRKGTSNGELQTSRIKTQTAIASVTEELMESDYKQCDKCKGYFTRKGLGPHMKRCDGRSHPRYVKPRVILTPGANKVANKQGTKHRSSCHRCGNLRPQVVACTRCPVIYCRRCSAKMVEEHGTKVFDTGCPVCKRLCCCADNKLSVKCERKYHCYKKCKYQRTQLRLKKRAELLAAKG